MTDRQETTEKQQQMHDSHSDIKPLSGFSNLELRDIFEGGRDGEPLPEIMRLYQAIAPGANSSFLTRLHKDMSGIFAGNRLGFRESSTKYHDLRHTRNVALATTRLIHGLQCQSVELPIDIINLGLICAYFHDTGMLLTVKDSKSSGAAYLKNHEERSIEFVRDYLHENGFPSAYVDNCEAIINCTNLTVDPGTIEFESPIIELTGHIMGTADILAQMADRYYLECLPLLYMEQQDAGIEQHPSSLALMRQTTKFYHEVIEKRLYTSFNGICDAMLAHFREWWRLDANLYMVFIQKNIYYLEEVVRRFDAGEGELGQYLRRRQPKAK